MKELRFSVPLHVITGLIATSDIAECIRVTSEVISSSLSVTQVLYPTFKSIFLLQKYSHIMASFNKI